MLFHFSSYICSFWNISFSFHLERQRFPCPLVSLMISKNDSLQTETVIIFLLIYRCQSHHRRICVASLWTGKVERHQGRPLWEKCHVGPTHTTVHMGPWTYQSVASGTQEELEGDDSLPTISTSPELLFSLDHMACLYCPSVSIS